jgi:cytoskeletal protein CcmA (bactofilin family)
MYYKTIKWRTEMAFFSKGKEIENTPDVAATHETKKTSSKTVNSSAATEISKNITIEGNISGTDSFRIEGTLIGNVEVNHVTIGKNGSVRGSIRAQKISIAGRVEGDITCNDLNISQTGYVTNKIHSNIIILSGEILGEVIAETSINVTPTGKVQTSSLSSKRVTVNGTIEGKVIASELLEVGSNGLVNGEISVKNIKTDEGGRVIGSMAMYTAPTNTVEQKKPEVIEATIEEN